MRSVMELFFYVLLLFTSGSVVGLQYPLSYQYRYRASVSSLLPDVGAQQAQAAIDTTLEVDTVSNNAVIVKLSNTLVSSHHGAVDCTGPSPDQAQGVDPALRGALEAPFRITYDLNKKPQIEVPPNDPLWMSNLRRGIASLLLVVPTTEHLLKRSYANTRTNTLDTDTNTSPLEPATFTTTEDTIYGSCKVRYTLTSAPGSARARHPAPKRDIQRSPGKSPDGSWPKISDYLYVLERSTDLNRCGDRPLVFASSNADGSNNNTASSDDRFFTQSSLGRLVLRGENDPRRSRNLRLEWAQVEAGAVMRPLGVLGGSIHVITNQTLELEMTYKKTTPRQLGQLEQLETVKYEMVSPFSGSPSGQAAWVRHSDNNDPLAPVYHEAYLTGYQPNATAMQDLKEHLLQEVGHAAAGLRTLQAAPPTKGATKTHQGVPRGAPSASEVGERVVAITEGIGALGKTELTELGMLVEAEEDCLARQIYREALAASGAPAAVAMVLESLHHQSDGDHRQSDGDHPHPHSLLDSLVSLATVASAAKSPVTARQLMNFVQTTADRSPSAEADRVLLQTAVLTTATAARRLCAPHNRHLYGRQFDDSCGVEADMLDFIRHQMRMNTSSTEKVVYLRALGYLKSDEAFEEIVNVIKSSRWDTTTRVAAVFSLMPSHTAATAKEKVFEKLDPVMTSQVEAPELRQAAAIVLLLWHPDQMWWHRLARLTWHEESTAMSAFVQSAVRAVAALRGHQWRHQRQYAEEVQSLLRPMLSSSRQSFLSIIETFTSPPLIEAETQVGWLLNMETLLPDDLFLHIHAKMNAVKIPLLEAEFYGDSVAELWRELRRRGGGQGFNIDSNARLLKEFNNILHGLGARTTTTAPSGGLLLLRLFSSVHAPLPLPASLVQLLASSDNEVRHGRDVNFFKFMNPVWREVVVPTEVGIPVVGRIRTPSFLYQKGRYEVHYSTKQQQQQQQQQHQQQSSTEWKNAAKISFHGNTTISSSMDSTMTVLVPWLAVSQGAGVAVGASVDLPSASFSLALSRGASSGRLHFHLGTDVGRKVRIAHSAVTPYTFSRLTAHGGDPLTHRIEVHPPHSTLHKTSVKLPPALGLSGHVTYEGDNATPHALPFNVWTRLLGGGGGAPQRGLQRHQTTLFLDAANASCSVAVSLAYDEAIGAQSGGASDSSRDFAEFELTDTPQRRRRKLLMLTGSGGTLMSVLANFSSGSHDILYEVLLASTSPKGTPLGQHERSHHLAFFRSGVPGDLPRPPKVCGEVTLKTPLLPPLDRLDKLLQDPLVTTFSGVLVVGSSCRGSKEAEMGSLKIQLSLSPHQLHHLARHLPGLCDFDRLDPTSSLRRAAFYDALQADLSWKQDIPKTLLNESYNLASVLRSLSLPYTSSNCLHVDSPQRRVMVNFTRSHSTRRATGWISRPGCLDFVEEMPFPAVVDLLLPFHGQLSQGHVHTALPAVVPPTDQCYVLPSRVVTFDGVSYDISRSTCSRVIFNYVSPAASVLITSQGESESPDSPQRYRILLPSVALDIGISGQTVQVNGEPVSESTKEISDPSGNTAVRITKTSDAVEVVLPGTLQVLVRSSTSLVLRVLDPALYRGAVRGLCGDFDGDAVGDLKDPRECLFNPNQGEVLAAAWTPQPCAYPDGVVDELKRHQWSCPRTPAELGLPAPKDYDPESCRLEMHKVVTRPAQVCLTTVPVPTCTPDCAPLAGTEREAMFEVKCWAAERLPESLKKAQLEGQLPYLEPAPGVLLPALLAYPMECVPTRQH